MSMILLKARPTEEQLADRLSDPLPEGLELYIDAQDISGDDWLDGLATRVDAHEVPRDFVWLVEGPVRSLDGEFFDLSVDSDANREVVQRLAQLGQMIGAKAACVHMVVPRFHAEPSESVLPLCLPLTRHYARVCRDAGLVPTVENIPPLLRQREGRWMNSLVGGPPEHLAWLADRVEGLRFTVDTSHAHLYLGVEGERFFKDYVRNLRGRIETAHVSGAEGVLGEGLPYGEGTLNLDEAVDLLLGEARWIVTEILEPDPDRSPNMRYAEKRIAARRAAREVRA